MNADVALEKLFLAIQEGRPYSPEEIPVWSLRYLAQREDLSLRAQIALSTVRDPFVITALASNPTLHQEAAMALIQWASTDGDNEIKKLVSSNISTNPSINEQVAYEIAMKGYPPHGYVRDKNIEQLCEMQNLLVVFHFNIAVMDWLANPKFIHSVDKKDPRIAILIELGFANGFNIPKEKIWKYQALFFEAYGISTFYY